MPPQIVVSPTFLPAAQRHAAEGARDLAARQREAAATLCDICFQIRQFCACKSLDPESL